MPGHKACLTRALDRVAETPDEFAVELDLGRRRLAQLHRHAQLDPPARNVALEQRAQCRLAGRKALRQPHLDVEIAVVDRSDGNAHRRPGVFPSERREAGH